MSPPAQLCYGEQMSREARLACALITTIGAAACGSDELTIRLVPAGFDRPYENATSLSVRVLDESFNDVAQFTAGEGSLVALGSIAKGQRRLLVSGIDNAGAVVARGSSRLLSVGEGVKPEVLIPFSSLGVVTALPVAPSINNVVRVDGVLGEWLASPSLVMDDAFRVLGPNAALGDFRAEIYTAWSGDRIAFGVAVSDDCPTLLPDTPAGDCTASSDVDRLALGFDGTDDGGTEYGSGDFYLELRASAVTVLAGSGITEADVEIAFGLLPNAAGWSVEGTIRVAALGRDAPLTQLDRVGLDVAIVDEDPQQSEATVFRLSGASQPARTPPAPASMAKLGFGQP